MVTYSLRWVLESALSVPPLQVAESFTNFLSHTSTQEKPNSVSAP